MEKVRWYVLAATDYEDGLTPGDGALLPDEDETCFPVVPPDDMMDDDQVSVEHGLKQKV